MLSKKELRKQLKDKILKLRTSDAILLCENNLIAELNKRQFSSVFIFLSDKLEPSTSRVIDELYANGKEVIVPFIESGKMRLASLEKNQECEPCSFGILQPLTVNERFASDLVIVPMLGFDQNLFRLGRGGGYYDKFLKSFQGEKIGFAFSFSQILFKVEAHDVALDLIVTDKGVLYKK